MIAYVSGTVAAKGESSCVLLTAGGVGYEIGVTVHTAAALPKVGGQAEMFVQTIVREDALELYGFPTWDERETFATLLSISKLGPKTALAMLSVYSPDDLRSVVMTDDYMPLVQVSGIGKKSAQRIFIELKYKLEAGSVGPAPSLPNMDGKAVAVFRDALAGLSNLGYDESEARGVLEKIFEAEPDLDVAGALRAALRHFSKARE